MKETYYWVPWFRELSKKIAEFADGGQREFLDIAQEIEWYDNGKVAGKIKELQYYFDPFSFLYTVASRNGLKSREKVYRSISEVFELKQLMGNEKVDYFIKNQLTFPTPGPLHLLFMDNKHPDKRNPDVLWKLLKCAVGGLSEVDSRDFSNALKIPGVGLANLTQVLCLINATEFMPTDSVLTSLKLDKFKSADVPTTEYQRHNFSLDRYKEILSSIREIFPGCELYEIGLLAYLISRDNTNSFRNNISNYLQVSTNVLDDGKDEWETFSENNCVFAGGGKYSGLFDADRGSVVFVRYGEFVFYGIGVVIDNEYLGSGGWDEIRKINVTWVNKIKGELTERSGFQSGFTHARNIAKVKTLEPYRRTIEQLEKIFIPPPPPELPSLPRNQILYGPPGTGKTWHTVKLSLAIVFGKKVEEVDEEDREKFNDHQFNIGDDGPHGSGQIAFTTFHQNYAYEDFIEGIRPTVEGGEVGYEIRDGIFKRLAKSAEDNPAKSYVLIIDEINRGNIAKIFGELITLIEDSKRLGESDAKEVILPYSQQSFGVPPNLFIIGTMNTADRSIQILDTALRRRFTFIEMMPKSSHEKISTDINGINCQKVLESMNRRIFGLLDRERQIGHTYFFDVTKVEQLADVFQNRIIPLLQEYFFDDWSKIRAVLGENVFVQEKDIRDQSLVEYRDQEYKYYERLSDSESEWNDPKHYIQIYQN